MADHRANGRTDWLVPLTVFVAVVIVQLWLVAVAGTDIPFYDQWGIEGGWLYPAWREGSLRFADLLRPVNEHRTLWTHLLNLGLFSANGQWDPLVQLVAIAGLRAGCAAGLAWFAGRDLSERGRALVVAGVTVFFLPHLAWHNVLWGMESHAFFGLGFSMLAFALLEPEVRSTAQTLAGLAAGAAALVAMAAGAFVPVLLLGLGGLRMIERRSSPAAGWRGLWPAALLLSVALALWLTAPRLASLQATSVAEFFVALGRALAWPHVGQPWAAFLLNLPLVLIVTGRLTRRRRPALGEDLVLLLGGWAVAVAVAAAWTRGAGGEFNEGVPSRYVDFLVLLPLANVWAAVTLAREAAPRLRSSVRLVAAAWGVFLFVGWLGLSTEVMRRLILPRMRDRDAPVRLIREFQRTDDPAVFAGQPRLLVPHPDLDAVRRVLRDPRMKGALPPSLQPEQPQGPLSRTVRFLLRRE
jgi:hypothetical protein